MANLDVRIKKDAEQLILLPINPRTFLLPSSQPQHQPGPIGLDTGIHCVVISGFAEIYKGSSPSIHIIQTGSALAQGIGDDFVETDSVEFALGPRWRSINQVTASVSSSSVISRDSDDVDHSMWDTTEVKWTEVESGNGKKIQLSFDILTQGDANGWDNFSYQVVATGNLMRLPTPAEISADI